MSGTSMLAALVCALIAPSAFGELDPSKCGKIGQVCCNIAADLVDCSEGTCLTATGAIGNTSNGKCQPCGAAKQPCCSPVGGLLPLPQNICKADLTCNKTANLCESKTPPPPLCGGKGQSCCIKPNDLQTCGKGLKCVRKSGGPRVGKCVRKVVCGGNLQRPCKGGRMFPLPLPCS
jgi:hypothetical protein